MNSFGRHYIQHNHDTDIMYLLETLPKMFYEIQFVLGILPRGDAYIFNDIHTYHKVTLPSGVITYTSKNLESVNMYINDVLISSNLIGSTIKTGDIIKFTKKGISRNQDIEFGLKIPIQV